MILVIKFSIWWFLCYDLPVNIGEYFQQVNGPELLYCPMANSSRKMGMPRKAKAMQYGMKKAPDIKGKQMRKPRNTNLFTRPISTLICQNSESCALLITQCILLLHQCSLTHRHLLHHNFVLFFKVLSLLFTLAWNLHQRLFLFCSLLLLVVIFFFFISFPRLQHLVKTMFF